jgi:molecular chaperone HtpG
LQNRNRDSIFKQTTTNSKILNDLLEKYLGKDVLIPYDIKERRKKFPLAFKELERYMKKYL